MANHGNAQKNCTVQVLGHRLIGNHFFSPAGVSTLFFVSVLFWREPRVESGSKPRVKSGSKKGLITTLAGSSRFQATFVISYTGILL